MAATPTAADLSLDLCEGCVSGWILPGEPKGQMKQIGPFNTYVATPPGGKAPSSDVALVYFMDALGLELINNKILPDKLAEALGVTVYVPDFFKGDGLADRFPDTPNDTATEQRGRGFFTKLTDGVKLATAFGPWILKHKPSSTFADTESFLQLLRDPKGEFKYKKLGSVGYCYGGWHTLKFNAAELVDVSVALHPSFLENGDFEKVKGPISFACADEDFIFTPALKAKAQEVLGKRTDVASEFIDYPDTIHGFAARPNLAKPQIKKAFEDSFAQTVAWLRRFGISS